MFNQFTPTNQFSPRPESPPSTSVSFMSASSAITNVTDTFTPIVSTMNVLCARMDIYLERKELLRKELEKVEDQRIQNYLAYNHCLAKAKVSNDIESPLTRNIDGRIFVQMSNPIIGLQADEILRLEGMERVFKLQIKTLANRYCSLNNDIQQLLNIMNTKGYANTVESGNLITEGMQDLLPFDPLLESSRPRR